MVLSSATVDQFLSNLEVEVTKKYLHIFRELGVEYSLSLLLLDDNWNTEVVLITRVAYMIVSVLYVRHSISATPGRLDEKCFSSAQDVPSRSLYYYSVFCVSFS